MTGIEHATLGVLALIALLIGPVIYYIRRTVGGESLFIRRIPGVDAVDEAAGRSAELGRPISFSLGLTSLGPVLYACLGVLYHVAQKAALYKTRLLLPQNSPEVMALVDSTVQEAYRNVGRQHLYDSRDLLYLSDEQFAFAAGYIGMIERERVGSAFLFGSFAAESLILAQAGQQVGALQVAATVSPEQVAFFICTCDYSLIGEELFAASAYLTKEPVQLGSLYGQDRAKLLLFLMIVVGVVIATVNSFLSPAAQIPNLDKFIMKNWW